MYSGKSGCIRIKWLYFCKICCIRLDSNKSCCIPARMVVIGQKWLSSGKNGCIRAKVVVFGKVVLFGQKRLYYCNMVVFGQKRFYSGSLVVFGQKLLYSGKSSCIIAKWL